MRSFARLLLLATASLAPLGDLRAQLLECQLAVTPAPAASTPAFGNSVTINATGQITCVLLPIVGGGLPAVAGARVCISAYKTSNGGTVNLRSGTSDVPYTVLFNNNLVGTSPVQVLNGQVPALTGTLDFPITFDIAAADYAGKSPGAYQAGISYTLNYTLLTLPTPPTCP
jgi:hypothetical protein